MTDEFRVPETLTSIAAQITDVGRAVQDLGRSMQEQFASVDRRFEDVDRRFETIESQVRLLGESMDRRLAETSTHLSVKIEHVDAKVSLAYEAIGTLLERAGGNDAAHERLEQQLGDHEIRLQVLERGRKPRRR